MWNYALPFGTQATRSFDFSDAAAGALYPKELSIQRPGQLPVFFVQR